MKKIIYREFEDLIIGYISQTLTVNDLKEVLKKLKNPGNAEVFKEYVRINYFTIYAMNKLDTDSIIKEINNRIAKEESKKSKRIYFMNFVKYASVNGGFVFVRWDKVKKENFIANKMIDPGVYYNLNAAKEIMRKQTDKANFTVDDVALQAPDQEQINSADLDELRAEFDLKNEEKRLEQEDAAAKQNSRRERKEKRKEKKDNTSELQ